MGRNFDDYPGFQPKITPPPKKKTHISQQFRYHPTCHEYDKCGFAFSKYQIYLEGYVKSKVANSTKST
jgi:hypothetical protein